jgi:hypothetical protein
VAVLDLYAREYVALEAASTFSGEDVGRVLTAAGAEHGHPRWITVDAENNTRTSPRRT